MPRLRKFGRAIALPALTLILLLAFACGTPAEPTAVPAEPTAAPEPTAMPAAAESAAAAAPAAMATVSEAEVAPPMSEYWNPPTDYYGDPVYGGTLRINYEDPLEHANAWGLSPA